ncbi:hypothetical protein TNCV_3585741 [Trichonephila clavipes]|nr:hypothetical protein TNCV_3585741 [Trichonephila clavipes]
MVITQSHLSCKFGVLPYTAECPPVRRLRIDSYEVRVEEQKHTIQAEEYRYLLQMMIPACYRRGVLRESITGESPTSFPEDTTMPYSGFEPEPTRLQAEDHIHHTGWAAK